MEKPLSTGLTGTGTLGDNRAPEDRPSAQREASGGPLATILVVEDDPDIRELVADALSDNGYRVFTAPDGPSALVLLRQERDIDLLFTDVVMPGGMTGGQLADLASEVHPGMKVLLASGFANQGAIGAGRRIDGRTFIPKPYRPRQLAMRIASLLEA